MTRRFKPISSKHSKRIFIFLDGITVVIVGVSQHLSRESILRIMKELQPSLEMEQQ